MDKFCPACQKPLLLHVEEGGSRCHTWDELWGPVGHPVDLLGDIQCSLVLGRHEHIHCLSFKTENMPKLHPFSSIHWPGYMQNSLAREESPSRLATGQLLGFDLEAMLFKKTNLLMESVSNLLMQTLRMDILTQCFFNQRGRLAFGLRRHLLKSHHFSKRNDLKMYAAKGPWW